MAGAETGITFKGFLKASGQAEVWDDTDEKKFSQFGWRTNTTESAYSTNTLIGNWNEEKFDLSKLSKTPAPPSQYDHYFSTTYKESFVKSPPTVPEVLRRRHGTGETYIGTCDINTLLFLSNP